jgi:hypothetical protein
MDSWLFLVKFGLDGLCIIFVFLSLTYCSQRRRLLDIIQVTIFERLVSRGIGPSTLDLRSGLVIIIIGLRFLNLLQKLIKTFCKERTDVIFFLCLLNNFDRFILTMIDRPIEVVYLTVYVTDRNPYLLVLVLYYFNLGVY